MSECVHIRDQRRSGMLRFFFQPFGVAPSRAALEAPSNLKPPAASTPAPLMLPLPSMAAIAAHSTTKTTSGMARCGPLGC
jgi:hypothetical protein